MEENSENTTMLENELGLSSIDQCNQPIQLSQNKCIAIPQTACLDVQKLESQQKTNFQMESCLKIENLENQNCILKNSCDSRGIIDSNQDGSVLNKKIFTLNQRKACIKVILFILLLRYFCINIFRFTYQKA